MNTNYENLKAQLIDICNKLLTEYENDIETGIKEGIYDAEDNEDNRKFIKDAHKVIGEFTQYEPAIYIYIEGYNIQGISGTEKISVNKLDTEDCRTVPEEQEMTPEEWDKMITEKTNNKEIKPIL